jgi:hypothetical protein
MTLSNYSETVRYFLHFGSLSNSGPALHFEVLLNGSYGPEAAVVRPSANGRKVPQCWRSIFAKWKSAIGAIEDVTLAVTAISKVNAPVCRLA